MFFGLGYFYNDILDTVFKIFETQEEADEVAAEYNADNQEHGHNGCCYYSVVRLMVCPPKGWETFGTNVDSSREIEFTKELDQTGLPLGERVRLTPYDSTAKMVG